jgi:hypothetical protein
MDLNFIITVFCLIDDQLKYLRRLREHSPAPTLCDSEVLPLSRASVSSSGSAKTPNSLRTSGATTSTSSRTSDVCIAPPSLTERYCVKKVWA